MAQVMLDLRMAATGEPLWSDPRRVLAGVLERLAADGYHPIVACELEFFLIDGHRGPDGHLRPPVISRTGRPLGYPTNLAVSTLEEVAGWCAAIEDAARLQDVPVGAIVAEMGVGQFEVNLAHQTDAILAADHAVLLKRIVRGVSRSLGWDATFMAKPYREDAGSGLHVHVSLADADVGNVFADAEHGEERLRHAVAGLHALLADTLAIFAPNRNSFRRFGGLFAPVNRKWGEDNRTVAFRIPTDRGQGRRIEHRVAGADANPYLAVAAILAAMHYGLSSKMEPPPPVVGKHAGHKLDPSLPSDVFAAARRLAASRVMRDYIPARYLEAYAHLLHHQHEEFLSELAVREYDFFL